MSQLARISWLVTVGICLITALILLISGYDGYAGVTLAVAIAAGINLTGARGPPAGDSGHFGPPRRDRPRRRGGDRVGATARTASARQRAPTPGFATRALRDPRPDRPRP